jgi:hypothetical protein
MFHWFVQLIGDVNFVVVVEIIYKQIGNLACGLQKDLIVGARLLVHVFLASLFKGWHFHVDWSNLLNSTIGDLTHYIYD